MKKSPRPYRQTSRAEATRETGRRILRAAVDLWRDLPPDAFTLQAIAERAGVTVQTVIRRYGSKEGVIEAAIAEDAAGVHRHRDSAPVGDLRGALEVLLEHYERDGDLVLRTLASEDRLEGARLIVQNGRRHHRQWCARVFAPWLPPPEEEGHAVRLDAFVAATDIYLWKLLRRDLGRSPEATRSALSALLDGLASS